ncbi:MAG TPA: M61 family peptidase [Gammaproteobacteria bacterium]|nr:M61 family peptidase [Gammaproteobacteria bacterium]
MSQTTALRYRLELKAPEAHLFQVSCIVSHPDPRGQVFTLPAWIPGSYLIRDFARHVQRVCARDERGELTVTKLDKQSWCAAPARGALTLVYEVYAWELSVRAAHLDASHAFFNGTSVFMQVVGFEHLPCELELVAPGGDRATGWRVATTLPRAEAPPYGFGTYQAENYGELIDHPVEMGRFDLVTFYACGYPHDVAISGRHRADLDRLARDLKLLCEHHIRFFGEPPPVERYLFLVTAVDDGYGGLEHRASSTLLCSRGDLPFPGEAGVSEDYRTFLGLCSHEYFHTWHIKRITPAALQSASLSEEAYTRSLWAFEGITSYYQNLALLRCGLISPESYLELLGRTATRVWRAPGRHLQSLADSSFDAWIKLYQPDENTPNSTVSYYSKGALVALCLDLWIRRETRHARSLDDVMRALWRRYGQSGAGVPEDGFERVAEEVSGVALGDFFQRYVHGTGMPPVEELLAHFGVGFHVRPAEGADDPGGRPLKESGERLARRVALGIRLAENQQEARLATVLSGSAAEAAGLAAGDVLVALDGLRVTAQNLGTSLAAHRPGERVVVHAFRRDVLQEFLVELQAPALDTCYLSLTDPVDGPVRARRSAWLGAV